MVQPILEYGNVIWGPRYVLDQRKLEGVQQLAICFGFLAGPWWDSEIEIKVVPSLKNESYIDQLTSLNLPSLLYQFRCGDLIFLFKLLIKWLDHSNFYTISQHTYQGSFI